VQLASGNQVEMPPENAGIHEQPPLAAPADPSLIPSGLNASRGEERRNIPAANATCLFELREVREHFRRELIAPLHQFATGRPRARRSSRSAIEIGCSCLRSITHFFSAHK